MEEICNSMPFALRQGSYRVEVVDALAAEILDMDVIKDEFKPSVPSIKDYLWGFITGTKSIQVYSIFQNNFTNFFFRSEFQYFVI